MSKDAKVAVFASRCPLDVLALRQGSEPNGVIAQEVLPENLYGLRVLRDSLPDAASPFTVLKPNNTMADQEITLMKGNEAIFPRDPLRLRQLFGYPITPPSGARNPCGREALGDYRNGCPPSGKRGCTINMVYGELAGKRVMTSSWPGISLMQEGILHGRSRAPGSYRQHYARRSGLGPYSESGGLFPELQGRRT